MGKGVGGAGEGGGDSAGQGGVLKVSCAGGTALWEWYLFHHGLYDEISVRVPSLHLLEDHS